MTKRAPHLIRVCRAGQGKACCKYLMQLDGRWTCGKRFAELKEMIDATPMKSKGDNCPGVVDLHQLSEGLRHDGQGVRYDWIDR